MPHTIDPRGFAEEDSFVATARAISRSAPLVLLWAVLPIFFGWTAAVNAQEANTSFRARISATDGSYSIFGAGSESPVLKSRVAAKVDGRWRRSTDYSKHRIEEADITDDLGPAHQFVVTHSGLKGAPDLVWTLNIRPDISSGDVELRVQNRQDRTIQVQAIRPLEAFGPGVIDLGGPEDADRVLSDSFSEDHPVMRIRDLFEKMPQNMHRAVGSQLIYNRNSRESLFLGALGADRFLTILRLHIDGGGNDGRILGLEADSTGTTEVVKEESLAESSADDQVELSLPVEPGQSLSSERLLISVGSDYHAQLERYGGLIRKLHHARIPELTPMGWWSWTAYYFGLNQETALTNARWLAENLRPLGFNFFHIDEGYQYARGEYSSPDAALFPDGMGGLESKIRGLGLTAGIWTAPFEVSERSWVYLHHREWLVHNAKGNPLQLGWVSDKKDRLYVLDTTHPGAQEYLRKTYHTLVNEWGVRYIKLDFMDDSGVEGYRYRPDTTALEAQRIGLTVIREAVGENVLLDKDGSPMLTPVGLVDTGRISVDTGNMFEATKEAAPGIAARYYMHRNFFLSDPDAFCISRQSFADAGWHRGQVPLTLNEARASIALSAFAGGMYEIGDDLPTLGADSERVALVENRDLINMIRLGHASRPLDLMTYLPEDEQPSIFVLKEDARQSMLAVFNWTDKPRAHEFNFQELGLPGPNSYQLVDIFEPDKTVLSEGGPFKIEQEPRSVRVLKIVNTSMPPAAPSLTISIPASVALGRAVAMSVRTDPNAVPALSYRWDFGDGTSVDGPSAVHAYTKAGKYTVKIAVEGIDGISTVANSDVSVSGEPNVRFVPERKTRMP